jgi:protease-4
MSMMWTLVLVGMMAAFGKETAYISDGSVLRLNPGIVTDAPAASFMDEWDFASMAPKARLTQLSTIQTIQAAAADNRIEGIYINFDEYASVSIAGLEEMRAELVKFKESGKFVVAYAETFGHADYYVASVADSVWLHPEGEMQWAGLSLQMMFYRGLLDKLDIKPEIFRHGSFKSAVEPFILEGMSPENRMQYEAMTGSIWGMMTEAIAEARSVSVEQLNAWADELAIDSPQSALEHGLVDGVRYEDEVMKALDGMVSFGDGDVNVVSFGEYAAQVTAPINTSDNKIAIIYAEGDIVSGDGATGQVASVPMVEKIVSAREDDDVKAVVLRVNSPGGSALASDVMWRELELLKAEKPVIVSMGAYAASGGYYISSPADVIYADRSTLTGSIGVYGLHANVGGALKKNLGITVDGVETNKYSGIGSIYTELSSTERDYIQRSVEQVYATFVGHVAAGRNMSVEAVDKIGQGRVWTGEDALEIGLVDGIGGLVDAIAIAADRAGIVDDFSIEEVSGEYSGLDALLSGLSASIRRSVMQDELGDAFIHYEQLREMLDAEGVQARMPYLLEIK